MTRDELIAYVSGRPINPIIVAQAADQIAAAAVEEYAESIASSDASEPSEEGGGK